MFDKQARPLVDRIVLPVPTKRGKGVLVSPTIYGNVMLGPTAEDLPDKTATGTSETGFEFLLRKGEKLIPDLLREEVTAGYAGLRAAINRDDYLIDVDQDRRYVLVGGIRSTGLTSAMAIAEHVRDLLGRPVWSDARGQLPDPPQMPNIGENFLRPSQDPARIAADPAYGRIVCFCERVTAGEIRDTYRSPIPPVDLSGLRRRTRAMNGRCQGFYCGARNPRPGRQPRRPHPARPRHPGDPMTTSAERTTDVLIIGGGPAGLTAAATLAPRLDGEVLVLDREGAAGGIPRHSDHLGYGIRDLKTFISGPAYARRLAGNAVKAGARVQTQTMVTGWAGPRTVEVTSPDGRHRITARAGIVLATGARERPRPARLIPGDRPAGVYTTGQLQNLVHLHHRTPGSRAVIIGAELVSWSAAVTLRGAHCRAVLMITTHHRPESYAAFAIPGRLALSLPVATRARITKIIGQGRVQAVELEHLDTGARHVIDCDTVVFTGDWIPDNELARAAASTWTRPHAAR